ncbi:MAG: 30S ribosomal protein S27e [Candidatus Pacearchaeota archaeon]
MQKDIRITKSKFVRVRCPKCDGEQIIFGKATTIVKCLKCKTQLTKPTGGKAKIRARVLEVLK